MELKITIGLCLLIFVAKVASYPSFRGQELRCFCEYGMGDEYDYLYDEGSAEFPDEFYDEYFDDLSYETKPRMFKLTFTKPQAPLLFRKTSGSYPKIRRPVRKTFKSSLFNEDRAEISSDESGPTFKKSETIPKSTVNQRSPASKIPPAPLTKKETSAPADTSNEEDRAEILSDESGPTFKKAETIPKSTVNQRSPASKIPPAPLPKKETSAPADISNEKDRADFSEELTQTPPISTKPAAPSVIKKTDLAASKSSEGNNKDSTEGSVELPDSAVIEKGASSQINASIQEVSSESSDLPTLTKLLAAKDATSQENSLKSTDSKTAKKVKNTSKHESSPEVRAEASQENKSAKPISADSSSQETNVEPQAKASIKPVAPSQENSSGFINSSLFKKTPVPTKSAEVTDSSANNLSPKKDSGKDENLSDSGKDHVDDKECKDMIDGKCKRSVEDRLIIF